MTSAVYARTPNLGLGLLEFNFPNWGDDENTNMKIIDASMSVIGFQIEGAWTNSTAYVLGDLVVDTDLNSLWRCMVGHTSATTGTFAQDRTAHPTYWVDASQSLHARGQWVTATHYYINDVVYKDANKYSWALVTREYTSSASYDTDVANGNLVIITDTTSAWTQFVLKGGDTMTGALTIPVTPTAVGHATSKQYVDNGLALKLNTSAYTAADVLAKLITVDGAGSNLDADLLDGQQGAFYLPAGTYTAADILAKLLTVDGAGSGLDADLLDGNSSAFYQSASNLNSGTLPAARFDDTAHGSRGGGALHALATAAVAGFLLDAPSDGTAYARRNAAWIATSAFVDAPSDGSFYGRVNAAWVVGGSKTYIDTQDALKVAKAGDTMTGSLTIQPASGTQAAETIKSTGAADAVLLLDKGASGQNAYISGRMNGFSRWSLVLGNSGPESSGNVGSDLAINRFNDAGAFVDTPFSINRANGIVTLGTVSTTSTLTVGGNAIYADGTINYRMALISAGQVYTGTITPHNVNVQINNAVVGTWSAGGLSVPGSITTAFWLYTTGAGGGMAAVNPGTMYIRPNGAGSTTGEFKVDTAGLASANGNMYAAGRSFYTTGILLMPNVYNNTVAGSANVIVGVNGEMQRATSSQRYKTDIIDYPRGLADLLKLRPVSFKPLESATCEEGDILGGKSHTGDDRRYAGLIAEDVHDAGMVEFVDYDADGLPDGLYYPTMVALLINTIKELTARVEALEAARL
jgi:hypothetical protein